MREVKFRVWDNVNYMSPPFRLEEINKTIQFTSECIVMQYTGLKDKNGKEIYEGDVIRIMKGESISTLKYKVVWNKSMFYADGWGPLGNMPETCDRMGFIIEVIGNIHENPELLK